MKIHKKFDHHLPGVGFWGKRPEIDMRINYGIFNPGETFPSDPLHYHETRITYFCVLAGELTVEVEGTEFLVDREAVLEVAPMEKYRTLSIGNQGCTFVVIGSHNEADRVEV